MAQQEWRIRGNQSNCSAIGLVLALAPIHEHFGLETVMAVSMQAVSGAGYLSTDFTRSTVGGFRPPLEPKQGPLCE